MPENSPLDNQNALCGRLHLEASLTRPEFSEQLHQRLRDSVFRPHAAAPPRHAAGMLATRLFTRLTAAAGFLAILTTGIVWRGSGPIGDPAQTPGPHKATLAEAETVPVRSMAAEFDVWAGLSQDAVARLDLFVSSTSDSRWAYLDQDARSGLAVLANAVPVGMDFLPWLSALGEESGREAGRGE